MAQDGMAVGVLLPQGTPTLPRPAGHMTPSYPTTALRAGASIPTLSVKETGNQGCDPASPLGRPPAQDPQLFQGWFFGNRMLRIPILITELSAIVPQVTWLFWGAGGLSPGSCHRVRLHRGTSASIALSHVTPAAGLPVPSHHQPPEIMGTELALTVTELPQPASTRDGNGNGDRGGPCPYVLCTAIS